MRNLFLVAATLLIAAPTLGDVRVVHASPDAPNVDVIVNDQLPAAIQNLAFKSATPYLALPSATYNFKVVPSGATDPVVIDADVPVDINQDISVVAANTLASIQPLVFNDDNTLDPANARIRFIHASPDAPAVDITLAGGGTTLFDDVSFTQSGGYISVPGGIYDLEVRTADGAAVVLSLPGVAVDNNTVYSIFAMGLLQNPNNPLTAVTFVDAIPEPTTLSLLAFGALAALRRR